MFDDQRESLDSGSARCSMSDWDPGGFVVDVRILTVPGCIICHRCSTKSDDMAQPCPELVANVYQISSKHAPCAVTIPLNIIRISTKAPPTGNARVKSFRMGIPVSLQKTPPDSTSLETRPSKTRLRLDKALGDTTLQGTMRQDKAEQDKTRRRTTRHGNTCNNKTRYNTSLATLVDMVVAVLVAVLVPRA